MARLRIAALAALLAAVLIPCSASAASGRSSPRLEVTGAALYAPQTGQLLYAQHPDRRLAIASTTKLMTALITLQHVRRLSRFFTQNDWVAAPEDSQIGLAPGERMSVHDLLLALMLPSADDAAEDLAYNVGHRSIRRFVALMNAEARRLRLTNTHYSTPIGLDTPRNFSSALDLDRLAAFVVDRYPFLRRVVNEHAAILKTGRYRRYVVNTNDLVGRVSWIHGIKTGHTADAGYVLIVSGTRGKLSLIGAVLGTYSEAARDQNALSLLRFGFSHFRLVRPLRASEIVARPLENGTSTRAIVMSARGVHRVVPRTAHLDVRLRLPRQITGPKKRGAVVGEAFVLARGHVVGRSQLVLARAVPGPSGSLGRVVASRVPLLTFLALGASLWVRSRRPRPTRARMPSRTLAESGR